jgi:D-inositol-3-phosphate glycosyltransferase
MDKSMLRVAMISYHTCPLATLGGKDTGGMNVYVHELTCYLGQAGVHVDVFTRSQDEHVPHVLHDLGYGNRVVHIPAGPETWLPKQQVREYLPEFSHNILQFAREKNIQYDIIHSHYWMSGIVAKELKEAWNAPIVHMFHTLGIMKNRIAQDESEKEGDYRIQGEQEVLQAADQVIAATQAEQSQLEFLYHAPSSKISVIPPGVDIHHFYPISLDEARAVIGIPCETRMLLFVGRIEPLKGLDALIHALANLRNNGILEQHPHCLAVIGGDPDTTPEKMSAEMGRLQALCHALGLDDLVVFLGKRGQDILPYYYSSADALIIPSHYESFGMVALEAMACGVPVIASQVGGLAFLVKDGVTGYVVPDGEAEMLSSRLATLITQPETRREMSEQSVLEAQNYSWEKITSRILEVYKKVLL